MKKILALWLFFVTLFIFGQEQNGIEILNDIPAKGCGNFMVLRKVKFEGKQNTFVILDFKAEKIILTKKFQKFELTKSKNIHGKVEILNTEGRDNYCTDAISPDVEVLHSLKLEKGTVLIKKNKDEENMKVLNHTPYRVDVILENAWFKKGNKKYFIKKIKFTDVLVSYMMG